LPNSAEAISSNAIYMTFRALFFVLYNGIAIAASIRVGNALGANDPQKAKKSAKHAIWFSGLCGLIATFAMIAFRNIYPYSCTTDPAVIEYAN